jgi:hypothetical protein
VYEDRADLPSAGRDARAHTGSSDVVEASRGVLMLTLEIAAALRIENILDVGATFLG